MTIAIGCDHAGFTYKERIKQLLQERGLEALDFGAHSEESVDYPDYAHPVATAVEEGRAQWGIVICGTGNGVAMTVNKHAGIRGALCWKVEIAALARQHNDANVLALPARFVSIEEALAMTAAFLDTPFEGGRHSRRIAKMGCV
jgi:ribose 5-phosphate isomerase B